MKNIVCTKIFYRGKIDSMRITRKSILIIVHMIFFLIIAIIIGKLLLINRSTSTNYSLEISSSTMERNSLKSEINILKTENDKLKFTGKEYSSEDYSGWKKFENSQLNYSFMYPADAFLDNTDHVNAVYVKSSDLNVSVIHFDSPFYHPPVGTDLHSWLLDKISYDEIGESIKILETDSLHLITLKSSQAYAADDYYLIRNGQLYDIKIVHSTNTQDWDLYYKFIRSFKEVISNGN